MFLTLPTLFLTNRNIYLYFPYLSKSEKFKNVHTQYDKLHNHMKNNDACAK